ncbi:MAG: fatty acid desaturase [Gemmataceae bacterium]|nr:fatty acid desaturase [Gemmataceae bacterium]
MHDVDKDLLVEAHKARWGTFWTWLAFLAALLVSLRVTRLSFEAGYYWITIPAMLLVAHLMHSQLLAFHEAAHGVLCPSRWLNETIGIGIGVFHFGGLSLFRAVHHSHHAHLGTERDEQLWPFVHPETPRWTRRLAAVFELTLGIVYDQVLFWRTFLRKDSPVRNPRTRRRIWAEAALMIAVWSTAFTVVAWFNLWPYFFVMYLIPAVLAGDMHSLRKYIEHMGLTGSTNMGLTRTVIPSTPLGRLLAFTMFNISYHGVHHYYAGMSQAALPKFTAVLAPQSTDEETVYPTYRSALRAMLPSLADPHVGPQWAAHREDAARHDAARPSDERVLV